MTSDEYSIMGDMGDMGGMTPMFPISTSLLQKCLQSSYLSKKGRRFS